MSKLFFRGGTTAGVGWALALLLGVRLLSLGLYPLMDNTEARYADISRVMFVLGDWVTPWFDVGVPFWGKPPLSFWTTALSFSLLGVNEFAARLPHFLAALSVGWLIWGWALKRSRQEALTAVALLAGCSLMLVSAGAVMTDMMLVMGTTLAMRGFWLGLHGVAGQRQREGWLLFLGLAIGLLAKGPLVLVLAGLPLGLWTLFNRQLGRVWRDLPWLRGSLLVMLLAGPWYALAEWRTPGFLNYFLLGEHWHRFVTSGWTGDRYGVAHSARWGSIWLYAVAATLPWALLLPLAGWAWRPATAQTAAPEPALQRYLILWSLAPLLFFTFAGNILWTYALPALPALALLGAGWLNRRADPQRVNRLLTGGLLLSAALFAGFVIFMNMKSMEDFQTTRALVAHAAELNKVNRNSPPKALIFYPARPYSAAFYSRGQAEQITTAAELRARLLKQPVYLAVNTRSAAALPATLQAPLQIELVAHHGDNSLLLITPISVTNQQGF